jgi:hypothetical protein
MERGLMRFCAARSWDMTVFILEAIVNTRPRICQAAPGSGFEIFNHLLAENARLFDFSSLISHHMPFARH